MSKNEDNCNKKWSYRNKQQAFHYAAAFALLAYKCPVCDRWHMTSKGIRLARKQMGLDK